MKAERRHELQENSLVRGVRNFPEFWKSHGQKITLGVILVLLTIVLVQLWLTSRADARRELAEKLSTARGELEALRIAREASVDDPRMRMMRQAPPPPVNEDEVAKLRKDTYSKVEAAVADVLKSSSEPAQQAEAKLIRGDLNYHFGFLATLGELPGAAKKADLKLGSSAKEYFDKAAQSYTEIISQDGSLPPGAVVTARLGMAAIYENRGDYSKAREAYEAVSRSDDTLGKVAAKQRLTQLSSVRTDQLVGKALTIEDMMRRHAPEALEPPPTTATAPTTVPTATQPATTAPTAASETTPATSPAASASGATTSPSATSPATTQPTEKPAPKPGSLLVPEFGTN